MAATSKDVLEQAEKKLEKAETKLKEAKTELEKAETKLEKAETKLEKAETKLKEAKTELEKAETDEKKRFAQEGVALAYKGVESAQEGVASAQSRVTSLTSLVNHLEGRLQFSSTGDRRFGGKSKRSDSDGEEGTAPAKKRKSDAFEVDLTEQEPLTEQGQHRAVQQTNVAGFGEAESHRVFVRKETMEQWGMLETATNDGNNLRVSGPPGTGKSTTAWAWALWTAKQKKVKVVWYHYTKNLIRKVVIDGKLEKVVTFPMRISRVKDDIQDADGSVLVFDGLTKEDYQSIVQACGQWRDACKDRTFILVSSVAVVVAVQEDMEARIVDCVVASWTFKQYQLACADDGFYDGVKSKLAVPGVASDDKDVVLSSKYYYAGACARWMFEFELSKVQKDFGKHLEKVSNYRQILGEGGSDQSSEAVNHLRALSIDADGKENYFFVSKHAMQRLAGLCDNQRDFLVKSYAHAEAVGNPAYKGWVFEFDVNYQLEQAHKKEKAMVATIDGTAVEWKVNHYKTISMEKAALKNELAALQIDHVLWVKPELWHQRAYDFLRFERLSSGQLRMVAANATLAQQHGVLLGEVHNLAKELGCVEEVRFDFIVPTGHTAAFKVDSVTGRLCEWKLGGAHWPNSPTASAYLEGGFIVIAEAAPSVEA